MLTHGANPGVLYLVKQMTNTWIEPTLPLEVYYAHGFDNREQYIDSLKEDYDPDLVDALTSMLPASEDFDGLVTELEDNAAGW